MSNLGTNLRSLWRFHRLLGGILVVEYALTFAISLSATNLLMDRAHAIGESSGVVEQGLYVLQGVGVGTPVHRADVLEAKQRFQALVGAENVAEGSSVPFLGMFSSDMEIGVAGNSMEAESVRAEVYEGGADFTRVLGALLLRGRKFNVDEVAQRFGSSTHVTILSETLATRLFHDEEAVGKQVSIAGKMHTVVGVIAPLAAPEYLGRQLTMQTLLLPKVAGSAQLLVIRYDNSGPSLDGVLNGLNKDYAGRVNWSLAPYASIRSAYFEQDRLAVAALCGILCVVLVTALCGILGLTNYWISKRRPQIAIRRALGGSKRSVIAHFLGESSLLVAFGLVFGLALNFAFSAYLHVPQPHAGIEVWSVSIALIVLLAVLVIGASLRRWLRIEPAELMRAI